MVAAGGVLTLPLFELVALLGVLDETREVALALPPKLATETRFAGEVSVICGFSKPLSANLLMEADLDTLGVASTSDITAFTAAVAVVSMDGGTLLETLTVPFEPKFEVGGT